MDNEAINQDDQDVDKITEMLNHLLQKNYSLSDTIFRIHHYHQRNIFKYIPKEVRNSMISSLQNEIADLRDISTSLAKNLKKVKRTKVTDQDIERLFGIPEKFGVVPDEEPTSEGNS